ncbi:accessory gene regulator B [Paenibacillus sp. BC26]|nr:accessory gene regulator B [Paenibacillus sp. BC26]
MLRKVAVTLNARMTANNVANAPSVDVIVYALSIIWNTTSITVFSLILGWLTGELLRTFLFIIIFATIRFLTGGYHLKSGTFCIIVSTAAMSSLPHIHLDNHMLWVYGGTVFSLIMVLLFAPANYDKYARISPKHYPILKVISACIVASNFLFVSDLLAVAFTVQAVLLPFKERG